MASGDVVNTAARLQSAAPVNGILVDETTYRATEQAIDYAEREPVDGEGQAGAGPRLGGASTPARASASTSARRSALRWSGASARSTCSSARSTRARQERSPQLVTLVGVPGIGKSRLVARALRSVIESDAELINWRQGRSLPYGEGVTFWALAEMVKAQAGILETDSPEETASKLARSVARARRRRRRRSGSSGTSRPLVGLEREQDARRRSSRRGLRRLAAVLRGARRATAARPRLRGPALGRRRPARLRRPPRRLGGRRAAARRLHGAPGAARPAAGLGRRKAERADALALAALRRRDRAARSHALLERAVLPAETQAALLARAGGNPLYAEEFARMVADRELARTRRAAAARVGAGDHRRPARRACRGREALLQDAAVVGKVFWLGAVGGDRRRRPRRGRGSAARARAEGVRPSRAPLLGRGRERVRVPAPARARRGLRPDPARRAGREAPARRRMDRGARACARTTPRCSRTTTRARSSSPAPPARTRRSLEGPARLALQEAGDRAVCPLRLSDGEEVLCHCVGGLARRRAAEPGNADSLRPRPQQPRARGGVRPARAGGGGRAGERRPWRGRRGRDAPRARCTGSWGVATTRSST